MLIFTYDEEIGVFVCKIYRKSYRGTNFSEFARIIQEEYGVQASRSTIYNFLRRGHIRSPQRKTKKRVVKTVEQTNVAVAPKKTTTKTLDTIARASTVTATAAVVGSQSTITISRKSSSFTHTLEYEFGSLTGTITTKTTSTSVKWTLPTSFYAQIGASATSKSGTITCKTYSGSSLVGTKTCSFTAKTTNIEMLKIRTKQ